MKKILPLFAGITLLTGISITNASELMQLTTAQMGNVAAGAAKHTCSGTIFCSSSSRYSNNRATATASGAHVSTITIANQHGSYASSRSSSP